MLKVIVPFASRVARKTAILGLSDLALPMMSFSSSAVIAAPRY